MRSLALLLQHDHAYAPLVYQRAVYFKLCRDHTKYSLHEIGKTLGYDHATVLHSLKLFEKFELMERNEYIKILFCYQRKNRRYVWGMLCLRGLNLLREYSTIK